MIDVSFDFRTDAGGKDPDTYSPTLRRYHKLLWSKELPTGHHFHLDDTRPKKYLHHESGLGEFQLASDSVIPTFTRWKSMQHIIREFPEEDNEGFRYIGYTIGGMMIFPGNVIDGKQTINGARGFNSKIADRFDLTLECIRRFYLGQPSPLSEVFERYRDFFNLFQDFRGYVEFFVLQDLVDEDCQRVGFFTPFDDFATSPRPKDLQAYIDYRHLTIEYIHARNRRIAAKFSE